MAKNKEVRTLDLTLNYLKNYFVKGLDFKSRVGRKEYFGSQFLALLSIFLLLLIFALLSTLSSLLGDIFGYIFVVYVFLVIWCQLPLSLRRLRDAGINPWWILIIFAPFGGLALFIMHCQPSKK